MGEEKNHKVQSLQILRFIADFPFLQSCQTATVPEGDYLHKPLGLSPCASSDNLTRDLCGSLLLTEQLEAKSVLPDPDFMAGSGLWHCLVWPAVRFKQKKPTGGIQWGLLLFLSLVPCARSCYWVVLTQGHQHETVQFFLYHINLISFVLCFEAKAPYHLCQLCCSFTSTINSRGFFLN